MRRETNAARGSEGNPWQSGKVWVVACVEHARASAEVRRKCQVVKAKDGKAINDPLSEHRQSAGVYHDPHSRRIGFTL
jgi:hypothetical protein